MEMPAVLLIFSLELKTSGVVGQSIQTKQQKMVPLVRKCVVKITLRLFAQKN